MHAQLLACLDDLARREGLITAETRKARIYRDPVGGTVAWVPHDTERLELTLIQVRMAAEQRAANLHHTLAHASGRTIEDIPAHELGLDADVVITHWSTLERDFFPAYLEAHRDVHAAAGSASPQLSRVSRRPR